MSLHVTGHEAASCVRFLEKAFLKWEREQSRRVALSASQAPKTKEQPHGKPTKRKPGTVQRVWTPDQIAAITRAIETKQTTRSLSAELGIPYGTLWTKRTQLEHSFRLSRLSDATSSSEQRVDVPHTD
ncbi:MAG: hypothetical protein FJY48_11695 [Betaproteobacteria bacterium]|nr:hypothetical protein [Betaproteobacteria bacterium]